MISQHHIVVLCIHMDFGEAKFITSRHYNNQLLIVDTVRHLGKAYEFHERNTKL